MTLPVEDGAPEEESVAEQSKVLLLGIRASVRTIKWLLFVMFVVTVGSVVRSESVQSSADKSTEASEKSVAAAEEARAAAQKASTDLAKAIEASQSSPIDPELIRSSLEASIKAECILDREYNHPDRVCSVP